MADILRPEYGLSGKSIGLEATAADLVTRRVGSELSSTSAKSQSEEDDDDTIFFWTVFFFFLNL